MSEVIKKLSYSGIINNDVVAGEGYILGIGNVGLSRELYENENLENHTVTVRYWISKKHQTKEEMIEGVLKSLYGLCDVEYNHVYSEYTGYLWTNESFEIGGHNLIDELYNHLGNYIILEIDLHES